MSLSLNSVAQNPTFVEAKRLSCEVCNTCSPSYVYYYRVDDYDPQNLEHWKILRQKAISLLTKHKSQFTAFFFVNSFKLYERKCNEYDIDSKDIAFNMLGSLRANSKMKSSGRHTGILEANEYFGDPSGYFKGKLVYTNGYESVNNEDN